MIGNSPQRTKCVRGAHPALMNSGSPAVRRTRSPYEWRKARGGCGSGEKTMPAMRGSAGSGNAAAGRGSNTVFCAGRAGIVQHAVMVQPGIIPLEGASGHAGHGWSALRPDCLGSEISDAIAASPTTPPTMPRPKANSSVTKRKRLSSDPDMPRHHRDGRESCQGANRQFLQRLIALRRSAAACSPLGSPLSGRPPATRAISTSAAASARL
jgi:hypothetical protein